MIVIISCSGLQSQDLNLFSRAGRFPVLYPSYFKLQMRWLRSLTPVTYLCTFPGIRSLAA